MTTAQSTDLPEEAVEALAKSLYEEVAATGYIWEKNPEHLQKGWLRRARFHLAAAASAIHEQERQRVREALLSDKVLLVATRTAYAQPISSNRREDMRAAFVAALNTLEDS